MVDALVCSKCGYSKDFGIIMECPSPRSLFDAVYDSGSLVSLTGESNAEKALKWVAENGIPNHVKYSHDLCGCPKCKEVYKHFFFRIQVGKKISEPSYSCEKCGHPLLRFDLPGYAEVEDVDNEYLNFFNCPSCGNKLDFAYVDLDDF